MPDAADRQTIRILSYNVHRCLGTDGRLAPERIAEVIASLEPDIVALQELDVGRLRSGNVDQAQLIAAALEMEVHFHPAMRVLEELYGDAVLTDLPVRLVRAEALPHPARGFFVEPRGAIWVTVECGSVPLQIVNTHLGLGRRERAMQVDHLLGPRWLANEECSGPLLLLGDLNAVPYSSAYRRLSAALTSADAPASFPSRMPVLALDHAFFRGDLKLISCRAVRTPLTRVASDHLPLVIDISLPREPAAVSRVETEVPLVGRE